MAGLPPYPDSNGDTGEDSGVGPDRGSTTSTPRWVKIFGLIALLLVLLVGIMLVTGIGGDHGPGRHMPAGGAGDHTPPSSVIEDHTLSVGGPDRHTPPIEHSLQQP